MEFEWDESKSERNFRERGFDYAHAALIFEGPVIEWCDIRKDWGEIRVMAVGLVKGQILTVIYTDRNSIRRIISARSARKKEVESWQSFANP
ncbi:MAG TPA: BrnT family toxin [Rhizomicrobium sp.]|nr:BrnT family toxin [Rhizomicrobium sp.]